MAVDGSDDESGTLRRLIGELRRRRVFRTAALYVVGAWLMLQVADVAFPGFGIPDAAIGALIWAAVLGFPIAIVFGWFFDVGAGGIRRTRSLGPGDAVAPQPLGRSDYLILAAFVAVAAAWVYDTTQRVRTAASPGVESTAAIADAVTTTRARLDNSVAVLPFANISSDAENEFFCDGISEEILNSLARFATLNVIGRTSSFAFKNSDAGAARISEALGVRFVLQGSVRKYGSQLRIAAQLLDANGIQVWAETFDRELRNVFEIQSEIASAVATMVASEVSAAGQPAHIPPVEAYEHFLAGRELLHRRDNKAANRELLRAIEIDPQFAEAHAELGISRSMGFWQQSEIDAARENIDRAIDLQPGLLRARAALGLWMQQQSEPDWAESERILREVLAQEPNMVDALLWLSNALIQRGNFGESDAILNRANRLDPLHSSVALNLAYREFERGNPERAASLIERLFDDPHPGYSTFTAMREYFRATGKLVGLDEYARRQLETLRGPHYWSMALSYGLVQDWERMHYWLERSRRDHPDQTPSWLAPSNLPAMQGRFHIAVSVHEKAREAVPDLFLKREGEFTAWLAVLYAKAGEYATAIELLEPIPDEAKARNASNVPTLDPIHALAWAYVKSGRREEGVALLADERHRCVERRAAGALHASYDLYACAEAALLSGDPGGALDELERAVAAGFSELYALETDPYWMPLHDDPRFQALASRVRERVAAARAEIERRDADDDFVARYDALQAQ